VRLGTKILLLTLLITIGTSATLAWIVTLNVTRYETRRADENISQTIGQYVSGLEERHRQIEKVVRALLEAPAARSQLQAADEAADPSALEQLKQEVFGRTVQTELDSPAGSPAFHVLINLAGDLILTVAPGRPEVEQTLAAHKIHWKSDAVINTSQTLITQYIWTPAGLFLAMGVPLHTQLNDAPSIAYFVGFQVDDQWVRHQLLLEGRMRSSTEAPLSAWFLVDGKIAAKASADSTDPRIGAFSSSTPIEGLGHTTLPSTRSMADFDSVAFSNAGERYLGQSFDIAPAEATSGRLILASSFDQALQPLHSLQRQILICTLLACAIAVLACRWIARLIARPIQELVRGTRRIADGQFDDPVHIQRGDELGELANAFNEMSQGLKERDVLRDHKTKSERDLALARKIQLDVLPKDIPACHGYDLAAYSLPAEQTGGDIYDVLAVTLDEDEGGGPTSLVLLLADATGHGVGPALSVTQVRAMLRIGVRLRAELAHVLAQINRQLCQDLGAGRFVTAFLGLLDPSDHCVNYHSAGQGPLMHFRCRKKQVRWLDSSMLPLGIDENPHDAGVQRVGLEPGDLVVLLTDGFYEFQNGAGDQFGQDRVADVILRHHTRSAKEILAELLAETETFSGGAPQMDDMTALIIKRQESDYPLQNNSAIAAVDLPVSASVVI
jgi:serine phosphatase RsbU (regulator of sigma subunit)